MSTYFLDALGERGSVINIHECECYEKKKVRVESCEVEQFFRNPSPAVVICVPSLAGEFCILD
jgi:hypothetical protein